MILFKDLDHGGIFKRSRFTVSWSRYSFLKFKVTLFKYQTKLFYHDFNFFGCTFCINLADLDRVFNFCRGTFYYFRHQLLLHQDKPQPHFQKNQSPHKNPRNTLLSIKKSQGCKHSTTPTLYSPTLYNKLITIYNSLKKVKEWVGVFFCLFILQKSVIWLEGSGWDYWEPSSRLRWYLLVD